MGGGESERARSMGAAQHTRPETAATVRHRGRPGGAGTFPAEFVYVAVLASVGSGQRGAEDEASSRRSGRIVRALCGGAGRGAGAAEARSAAEEHRGRG